MEITIKNTSKIVELNGVPSRIWEGKTSTGIKVHCYIPRVAIDINEPEENAKQFQIELMECRPPSARLKEIPSELIL